MEYGRLPTVAEYYKEFIDHGVNLIEEPKQFCPFHDDGEKPSFSFLREKGIWSCFGRCKVRGANVIKMHQMKFKLNSYEEAEESLRSIYKCPKIMPIHYTERRLVIDESNVEYQKVLNMCIALANTAERWVELDNIMTYYPQDKFDLEDLLNKWDSEGVK